MKKIPYANADFSYLETMDTELEDNANNNNFRFDYLIQVPKTSDLDDNLFDFLYLDHVWEEKD